MRALRILLLAVFLVTAGVYGGITVKEKIEEDTVPPVITADADEITVSVSATDEELLAGMHAEDNLDGDVTNTLIVVSKLDFITKGMRKVNYAAFDSHNNVATYTRKIIYNDYSSPRFSANAPFNFVYNTTVNSMFSQVTARDVLDGDVTQNITYIYGEPNEGGIQYPTILQVTNSAGDTASITVNVYREDRTSYAQPRPALSQYIVYTKAGEDIDLSDYIIGYYRGGTLYRFDETEKPEFTEDDMTRDTSQVDIYTPGEYTVTFQLNQQNGEEAGKTELYWIVEE